MNENEGGDLGPREYLGYQLIVRIKERSSRQISRSKFLKLYCIADRYLRDELSTDIGLPRYWYKYGEILDEQSINNEFYHAPSARGYAGQQYLTSRPYEDEEFDLDADTRRRIDEAVVWTALRFGKRNAEQIKNHQYNVHAPGQFIHAYSELRERLDVTSRGEQAILGQFTGGERDNQEFVRDLLDEMLLTYPKDEYEVMYELYLRWDDTARLILADEQDYDALNRFLDEFIEALSKIELRFHHSVNLPSHRLERWQAERDHVLAEFEETLEKRRADLLSGRESSGELEKVADEYNAAVNGLLQQLNEDG